MTFLKGLFRNLAILFVIGIVLLLVAPSMMSQVYSLFGALFGPLLIVIIIVAALPRRSRSRSDKR